VILNREYFKNMNFVHGAVLVKNCPTVITLQLRQLQQCRDKKKENRRRKSTTVHGRLLNIVI